MATPTSGAAAAKQNGTAKSGRVRHVKSQAGAARYHKPIGAEIGGPRDANHAAIQQDQGARKSYGDLIGGDQAKQRQALDGMNTEDLNKLADIAFSFKSSNPQVVALRIAARNAQARRGIRVPVGQTQTNPTVGKKAPTRGAVRAMSSGSSAVGPASQRLIELANATAQKNTSSLGSFPIPDVAHLRKAISAIGRAKPEHRPIIARHIIARAAKLKAGHLVSDHIKHYARGHREPGTVGMARGGSGEIELAGRWKHGYIPLDGEALASKMKGRTGGKKWWGDGTHGGTSGRLHGSPKSGSPQGRGAQKVAKPHQVSAEQRAIAKKEGDARRAKVFGDSSAVPKDRTTVVKSGSPKTEPRGAKVNDTYTRGHAGAKDGFDRGHRVSYTLNGKKHTGTITRIENGSGATVRRNRGEGAHDLIDRKALTHVDTPEKRFHRAYLAADRGSPEQARYAAETKQHFDARAKADIANGQERAKLPTVEAKKKYDQARQKGASHADAMKHASPKPLDKMAELHAATLGKNSEPSPVDRMAQLHRETSSAPVKLTPKTREALVAALDDSRGQVPFKTSSQGEMLRKQGLIRDSGVPGKRWVLTDKGRAEAQKAKQAGGPGKA